MHIDIVIATYNRADLLPGCVQSILDAPAPAGLSRSILIVDNNSSDQTAQVGRRLEAESPGQVRYLFEPRPGKSHALNTGIVNATGELVGMVDDDEEVDRGWLHAIGRAFQNAEVSFIGGPYYGKWICERPRWLPPRKLPRAGHSVS